MSTHPVFRAILAATLTAVSSFPWQAAAASAADPLRDLTPEVREKIDPALYERLNLPFGDGEAFVPIILTMTDQVDLTSLEAEIVNDGLGKRERARVVIAELRSVAERSQPALEAALDAWRASGEIDDYRAYWLINAFSLRASPAVIVALAERADVVHVWPDGPLALDRPEEEGPAPDVPGSAEIGLVAVNAPALWELGYTGAGVIVMNIDTGVAGDHPSLASRWAGLDPLIPDEDAWFDPIRGSCTTPCDYGTHGTHTMGIMTGLDPATADTIGVAFGARWIAAATIDVGSPSTSYSIAAFEWAVDPSPGSETRPPADVISCSWQDASVGYSGDCGPDGTYWAVIDAFEAIGGAVVWSAGNGGPGAQTITRPKNRISSPVNVWATGNVNAYLPGFPIRGSSSRGPSNCDGVTIKPEAVAPGTSIRSAVPGGYEFKTGTSMASPHAGGVIALLMEAFPWATGTEIKLALIATARDLGANGEDNTYGHGLIDAFAAYEFLQAMTDVRELVYGPGPRGDISLSQNSPNPFNPSTSIRYQLPSAASVDLKVYNARGQVVAVMAEGKRKGPGAHTATWDGRTTSGSQAASGMYFFRLEARPESDPAATPVIRMCQGVLIR